MEKVAAGMMEEFWCLRVGGGKLRVVGEVNGCGWGVVDEVSWTKLMGSKFHGFFLL